jgi:hypothetical protein
MSSIRFYPLILLAKVAFLRSHRLAEVLTFFLELYQLSRSNIFPLHKSAVDMLLLRAFQDRFHYRGRSLEFNFGDHRPFFISEHISLHISSIVTVQSSCQLTGRCPIVGPKYQLRDRRPKGAIHRSGAQRVKSAIGRPKRHITYQARRELMHRAAQKYAVNRWATQSGTSHIRDADN